MVLNEIPVKKKKFGSESLKASHHSIPRNKGCIQVKYYLASSDCFSIKWKNVVFVNESLDSFSLNTCLP